MYVQNTVDMVCQDVPQEILNIISHERSPRSTNITRTFVNASDYFQNSSERFVRSSPQPEDCWRSLEACRSLSPLTCTKLAISSFWKYSVGLFALFLECTAQVLAGNSLRRWRTRLVVAGKAEVQEGTLHITSYREETKCYEESRIRVLEWKHSCDRCTIL